MDDRLRQIIEKAKTVEEEDRKKTRGLVEKEVGSIKSKMAENKPLTLDEITKLLKIICDRLGV